MNTTDSTSYGYFMLGGMALPEFWAAFTFALMGQVLITAWNVRNGIRKNPHTDFYFNIKHFGWDSAFRVLCTTVINLITIFFFIRFSHISMKEITAMQQWGVLGSSFFVGMAIDKVSQILVSKRDTIK